MKKTIDNELRETAKRSRDRNAIKAWSGEEAVTSGGTGKFSILLQIAAISSRYYQLHFRFSKTLSSV